MDIDNLNLREGVMGLNVPLSYKVVLNVILDAYTWEKKIFTYDFPNSNILTRNNAYKFIKQATDDGYIKKEPIKKRGSKKRIMALLPTDKLIELVGDDL